MNTTKNSKTITLAEGLLIYFNTKYIKHIIFKYICFTLFCMAKTKKQKQSSDDKRRALSPC